MMNSSNSAKSKMQNIKLKVNSSNKNFDDLFFVNI